MYQCPKPDCHSIHICCEKVKRRYSGDLLCLDCGYIAPESEFEVKEVCLEEE